MVAKGNVEELLVRFPLQSDFLCLTKAGAVFILKGNAPFDITSHFDTQKVESGSSAARPSCRRPCGLSACVLSLSLSAGRFLQFMLSHVVTYHSSQGNIVFKLKKRNLDP